MISLFIDFVLFSADIVIISIVLLSLIFGWLRGITKEILSIVAWVGGIYLAIILFPYTKELARSYINHGLIADFVTVCGLFVLFLTIISIFNYFCSNFIKKSVLNITDKALGAIFGIVRGMLIVAILDLVIAQYMLNETPKWIEASKLRPTITSISDFIILILPDSMQSKLLSHMNQIKKQSLLNFVQNEFLTNIPSEELNSSKFAENAKKEEFEEFIDDDTDTHQTAEELATLKPKRIQVEKKETERNSRERNDMDRLLDQYDDIDEN